MKLTKDQIEAIISDEFNNYVKKRDIERKKISVLFDVEKRANSILKTISKMDTAFVRYIGFNNKNKENIMSVLSGLKEITDEVDKKCGIFNQNELRNKILISSIDSKDYEDLIKKITK